MVCEPQAMESYMLNPFKCSCINPNPGKEFCSRFFKEMTNYKMNRWCIGYGLCVTDHGMENKIYCLNK